MNRIEIETKQFIDGALAVPSMISGEVDLALMTPNASLFNSVAKGAPMVIFLDRGGNAHGEEFGCAGLAKLRRADPVRCFQPAEQQRPDPGEKDPRHAREQDRGDLPGAEACADPAVASAKPSAITPRILPTTVRPEPVEGLFFLRRSKEGKGFDRLSPNGSL